jgi:phosphohistidine phosphatase
MQPKRLVILRHAKSSWKDRDLVDHDRPLNARGRRAAKDVGHYLRRQGIAPALVLCSSAARTRETLELLELEGRPEVSVEDQLYGASAGELVVRLQRVTAAVPSVLLIGHNPGVQDLALTLAGDDERLASFPTAALADLRVAIAGWQDLRPGGATLYAFTTPQELD